MPYSTIFRPFLAFVLLLTVCTMVVAETSPSWGGSELGVPLLAVEGDTPWVVEIEDVADAAVAEADGLPRCLKPVSNPSDKSLACECSDFGAPSMLTSLRLSAPTSTPFTVFPLAQSQRIVQPPHRPPRWA